LFCVDRVVLCTVCVSMCTVLLPPGVYPIAVKYIISYHMLRQRMRITQTSYTAFDGHRVNKVVQHNECKSHGTVCTARN